MAVIAFACCAALLPSCKKDPGTTVTTGANTTVTLTDEEVLAKTLNLPSVYFNYANPEVPAYIQNPALQAANNTGNNIITNEIATLGRVIFYDKLLSANQSIACASCHKQAYSFADPEPFSKGFDGGATTRNSMSLANAMYYQPGTFFWDERAATLEDQALMPIQHPVEMGMTLDSVTARMQAKDYYRVLFRQAYGDETVTSVRISTALAQFVRSMVSYHSKYDDGLTSLGHPPRPGDNMPNFTADENTGLQLYQQHCAPCHGTVLQIANQARNNGLDAVYTDKGVGAITNNPADDGKFKVPSLRNVALTAPYMHDGRFGTLAEVVAHYNNGIENTQNLDPRLRVPGNGQPIRLNLTQQQQEQLVAFLNTLTDNQFITDIKYSDPFKAH